MALKLRDVNGWHDDVRCVPTMLCSISGYLPLEIARVLQRAAASFGVVIPATLIPAYNINHWLRAIKMLCADYEVIHDLADQRAEDRPSIDNFLASNDFLKSFFESLLIIFCDDPNCSETHVFATEDCELVDTYTRGKKIAICPVPPEYKDFRVKRVFRVVNS